MPIPRLRYSAARTVRLYRRLLQSCADPLRHRLYHPTAGRGQSRVTRCPLFRGKVTEPQQSALGELQQFGGRFEILRTVGVEERVDRAMSERDRNEAMTRRPFVDLTYAVVDNCAAEILAQPQRPESKHWVGAA